MNNISILKSDVAPKLHGTTLSKVSGFYSKMKEASNNMRAKVKPSTITRRSRIGNAIYNKVYNYSCPSWLENDNIIDLRPIGNRDTEDQVLGSFIRNFDIKKQNDSLLIEYINGNKSLRLSKELNSRTILHRMDSITLGGIVTLGGDASNATIDNLDYISGSGSLKFDLSGLTGQATITIALDQKIDLSNMMDLGALFEYLKFPDSSRLTNVDLKWGSSSSVYWNKTVTAALDRSWESNAWMLLIHEWNTASKIGYPVKIDAESINYLQITINYTIGTSLSGVGLDNITASLGKAYEIIGYSNNMFTDVTGANWKDTPTKDTDLIQLDGDGYNIFMYELMLTLQQELKGKNMKTDFLYFNEKLGDVDKGTGLYGKYIQKNPNESLIRQVQYYKFNS